ncbi:MAG: hypothetical protein ACE37D_08100 [Pseudomonadales bacterium]
MQLKPHDTVVALKYGCLALQASEAASVEKTSIRSLANSLGLSPGEVSKSNKRLLRAKLIAPSEGPLEFNTVCQNMREWLCFGIQYAVLIESRGLGTGVVTGWSNPEVKSEMLARDIPQVWLYPGGSDYGEGISPLYPNAPAAANSDRNLHQILSLIDAIRTGKPRELEIARRLVEEFMEVLSDAQKLR